MRRVCNATQYNVGNIMEQYYFDLLGKEEQVITEFWNSYFETCTMSEPSTGMEMPHEETVIKKRFF
jgi:hypothetical protein